MANGKHSTTRPDDPQVSHFEMACYCVNQMPEQERIALMKFISASLGGPRFYTATEVAALINTALEENAKRQREAETLLGQARRWGRN